jgi:hypothetical protein
MRISRTAATICIAAFTSWSCGNATVSSSTNGIPALSTSAAAGGATIAGFAFVDSSVTGQHSNAKLPPGTKIYPPGSKLSGTDGCPTTQYQTNGLPIAIIDYAGRPTSASVAVTRHPASGGTFENAPYYLDLNAGRSIQFLGPWFDNGTYDVVLTYDYSLGAGQRTSASYTLARSCPPPRYQ